MGPTWYSDISDSFTNNYVEHLEQVIQDNEIDVVYGHSRGASIMSKIKADKVTKIGLDGASVIGDKDDYLNIIQSQFLSHCAYETYTVSPKLTFGGKILIC